MELWVGVVAMFSRRKKECCRASYGFILGAGSDVNICS